MTSGTSARRTPNKFCKFHLRRNSCLTGLRRFEAVWCQRKCHKNNLSRGENNTAPRPQRPAQLSTFPAGTRGQNHIMPSVCVCICIYIYICVCDMDIYIYRYTKWWLIKIPLSGNGHSSRVKNPSRTPCLSFAEPMLSNNSSYEDSLATCQTTQNYHG